MDYHLDQLVIKLPEGEEHVCSLKNLKPQLEATGLIEGVDYKIKHLVKPSGFAELHLLNWLAAESNLSLLFDSQATVSRLRFSAFQLPEENNAMANEMKATLRYHHTANKISDWYELNKPAVAVRELYRGEWATGREFGKFTSGVYLTIASRNLAHLESINPEIRARNDFNIDRQCPRGVWVSWQVRGEYALALLASLNNLIGHTGEGLRNIPLYAFAAITNHECGEDIFGFRLPSHLNFTLARYAREPKSFEEWLEIVVIKGLRRYSHASTAEFAKLASKTARRISAEVMGELETREGRKGIKKYS